MPRVLIVEDVPALRKHVAQLINERFDTPIEIYEVESGAEAAGRAEILCPDLIIMDILMPGMNGIKAAQEIWNRNPAQKILFWSQYHREAYVRELGKIVPDEAIHGYALKSEPDEKLVFAISSVLFQDNPYIDPVVRGVQVRLQCKDQSISDVEYETLLDIALGLTDKAIAQRRHISVRGVQNRMAMLSTKLLGGQDDVLKELSKMEFFNPRTRIVLAALKRGLIDAEEICELDQKLCQWLSQEYDSAALTR